MLAMMMDDNHDGAAIFILKRFHVKKVVARFLVSQSQKQSDGLTFFGFTKTA